MTLTQARTRVDQRAAVRIGPPLRGPNLAVLGCCGKPFGHRLAALDRSGRPVFALNDLAGNSSEPHLHFHIIDAAGGPSNLVADGLPYAFDAFTLDSHITGLDQTPPTPTRNRARPPAQRTAQYPLTGDVITFR